MKDIVSARVELNLTNFPNRIKYEAPKINLLKPIENIQGDTPPDPVESQSGGYHS